MILAAHKLKLRNIGQLAEFVTNGTAVMGRIERIKIAPALNKDAPRVTLRLSGESHSLDGDKLVNVIRSSELHEQVITNINIEDLVGQK